MGTTTSSSTPCVGLRVSQTMLYMLTPWTVSDLCRQTLPWERIIEATEMLEGAHNTGKIVCTIGEQ